MSLAGFIVGLFLLMVWVDYEGSLVDDFIEFLRRKLNEKRQTENTK